MPDTDLIIYVAADCIGLPNDVVAFAGACQLESELDRWAISIIRYHSTLSPISHLIFMTMPSSYQHPLFISHGSNQTLFIVSSATNFDTEMCNQLTTTCNNCRVNLH